MKYFTALVAAAAAVSAATLGDYVPECSLKCLSDARAKATTCKDDTELACICILENYRAIYDASVTCVLQGCGQDVAVGEVLPAVVAMCEEVLPQSTTIAGEPLTTPTMSASSTASAATSATSAGASETSKAAESASPSPSSGANSIAAGLIGVAAPLAIAALL